MAPAKLDATARSRTRNSNAQLQRTSLYSPGRNTAAVDEDRQMLMRYLQYISTNNEMRCAPACQRDIGILGDPAVFIDPRILEIRIGEIAREVTQSQRGAQITVLGVADNRDVPYVRRQEARVHGNGSAVERLYSRTGVRVEATFHAHVQEEERLACDQLRPERRREDAGRASPDQGEQPSLGPNDVCLRQHI